MPIKRNTNYRLKEWVTSWQYRCWFTHWIQCFDIDRCNPLITTPDEFIKTCLPACFQNVSYIWQVSNSAMITKRCLAGHLFFLHAHPINAKILKQIYTALNFSSESLAAELRLSHNGQTLSFGLDPTTAQNDKLIFIAPPTLTRIKTRLKPVFRCIFAIGRMLI